MQRKINLLYVLFARRDLVGILTILAGPWLLVCNLVFSLSLTETFTDILTYGTGETERRKKNQKGREKERKRFHEAGDTH